MEPEPPRSVWRQALGGQIAAAALTLLTIVAAILIGSQVLLFLAILVLCALAAVVLHEHVARRRWLGAVLVVAGIAAIALAG